MRAHQITAPSGECGLNALDLANAHRANDYTSRPRGALNEVLAEIGIVELQRAELGGTRQPGSHVSQKVRKLDRERVATAGG